jgi:hypothetical protein
MTEEVVEEVCERCGIKMPKGTQFAIVTTEITFVDDLQEGEEFLTANRSGSSLCMSCFKELSKFMKGEKVELKK